MDKRQFLASTLTLAVGASAIPAVALAAQADGANFLDVHRVQTFLVEEAAIV